MNERLSSGGWLEIMCVLTVIGGGWGALMIVPLFASPRTRRFGASLTAVMVVTSVVVFVAKSIIRRERPYLALSGVHTVFFDRPTDYSCPSGHAAGSFSVAVFIAVVLVTRAMIEPANAKKRRIALAVVALASAFGIAISRCALGVHFPSDILAGAVVGSAIGALGARWHIRRTAV